MVADTRAIVCWPGGQSQGKHSLFVCICPETSILKRQEIAIKIVAVKQENRVEEGCSVPAGSSSR